MSDQTSNFERGIIRMFMRNTAYQEKYPYTKRYNVFSASSLSGEVKWAFKRKVSPDFTTNVFMIAGTAIHEYLQRRFGKGEDCFNEMELKLVIPFAWQNLRREDGTLEDTIIITGHIDNIDVTRGVIIELKTSFTRFTDWPKYIIQAGFYGAWVERKYEREFTTKVIHLSRKAEIRVLSKEDKYNAWVTMQYKALFLAKKIDKWLGETSKA